VAFVLVNQEAKVLREVLILIYNILLDFEVCLSFPDRFKAVMLIDSLILWVQIFIVPVGIEIFSS
jgi:hypothetical protein